MPIATGANSVAAALGNRLGRDPLRLMRRYHEGRRTTPIRGTFYLAGSRNFLYGSNISTRIDIDTDWCRCGLVRDAARFVAMSDLPYCRGQNGFRGHYSREVPSTSTGRSAHSTRRPLTITRNNAVSRPITIRLPLATCQMADDPGVGMRDNTLRRYRGSNRREPSVSHSSSKDLGPEGRNDRQPSLSKKHTVRNGWQVLPPIMATVLSPRLAPTPGQPSER